MTPKYHISSIGHESSTRYHWFSMGPSIISSNRSTRTLAQNSSDDTVSVTSGYQSFHHIVWYVGNAKQAASYYVSRFGFRHVAYVCRHYLLQRRANRGLRLERVRNRRPSVRYARCPKWDYSVRPEISSSRCQYFGSYDPSGFG
jgi:hypothetical protein